MNAREPVISYYYSKLCPACRFFTFPYSDIVDRSNKSEYAFNWWVDRLKLMVSICDKIEEVEPSG